MKAARTNEPALVPIGAGFPSACPLSSWAATFSDHGVQLTPEEYVEYHALGWTSFNTWPRRLP